MLEQGEHERPEAVDVRDGRCTGTIDDLRHVFSDHELIASLGCESVLNMPVRWRGRTLGSLNLLHEAGWYGEDDVAACLPFAQLALPALLTQS